MLKKGERVIELTKKVGQHGRTGVVVELHEESAEVKWDDGHLSIVSRSALAPRTKANKASAHQG